MGKLFAACASVSLTAKGGKNLTLQKYSTDSKTLMQVKILSNVYATKKVLYKNIMNK